VLGSSRREERKRMEGEEKAVYLNVRDLGAWIT
jgi:hypothetical protein